MGETIRNGFYDEISLGRDSRVNGKGMCEFKDRKICYFESHIFTSSLHRFVFN